MIPTPPGARVSLWSAANCALLIALVVVGGCARSTATVSGKVSYQNKPLTHGEIHFVGADGKSRSSVIGHDGTYKIDDAPVGAVKVAVVAVSGSGNGKLTPNAFKVLPKPVEVVSLIPTKYNDPNQSGLVYSVARKAQTINIELED